MLRSISLAVFSGVLLGFSQPVVLAKLVSNPVVISGLTGLLSLIGFVPVVLELRKASPVRSFWLGLTTGIVQYFIVVYWIYIALHVFGGVKVLTALGVLTLLAIVLGVYIACAFALSAFLARTYKWSMWLFLPAAMSAVEYLRNFIIVGGFPWGNVGYSLAGVPILLQAASLVGVYGLVFCIVLANVLLAEVLKPSRQSRLVPLCLLSALLVGWVGYGAYRFTSLQQEKPQTLKVGLLQGNIEQGIKNHAAFYYSDITERYQKLQTSVLQQGAELVVWPEAALPIYMPVEQTQLQVPLIFAKNQIIGTVTKESTTDETSPYGDLMFHNSAVLVDASGFIKARYDKAHLVPFGEYVPWPFKALVERIVPGIGAFTPGQSFVPFDIQSDKNGIVKTAVTICYEGVFPEISRSFVLNGAQLLLNLSNDAWYGVSSAPYQHLNMYVLRAVENGRTFARATNTGISGWIDRLGSVHEATALYEEATVVADLPLSQETTLYTKLGDMLPVVSFIVLSGLFGLALVGRDFLLRKRSMVDWLIGLSGLVVLIFVHWYYRTPAFLIDEASHTKLTVMTVWGFVLAAGALSDKQSGYRAIAWVTGLLALLCAFVGFSQQGNYWAFCVLNVCICLLSLRRTGQSRSRVA